MKLYSATMSPFAARARLALRIKGVPFQQVPPPGGGTRTPEFLAINPIGKVPVLITDGGLTIAESETIIDYLDDRYPTPPLMPSDDAARAQVRNAIRVFEGYATPALFRLFRQLDPQTRDDGFVAAELAQLRNGLTLTQNFVDDAPFAAGGALSKADCILLPTLPLCATLGSLFGIPELIGEFPRLAAYGAKAREHPHVAETCGEVEAALRAAAA